MANSKKIAVLGGGNGAHTMAADLTIKGFRVNMCEAPQFVKNIKVALERQAIDLIDGCGERHSVKLNLVTTNFEDALKGTHYVMLCIPGLAARDFFSWIIPYLEDGQTIIKWSANFSSLLFANMLREKGIKNDITLAEAHTLPWGCRMVAPGTTRIAVWAIRLLLATLPANKIDGIIEDVKKMYPVIPVKNILATSLNNLNPIVHPVACILNTGWIETAGENFYLYRDGNTLSVSRAIKSVFEDVSKVANAIGVGMNKYPEEDFWKKSAIMSTYFRAAFDKEGAVASISGPSSMKNRYVTEDLPYGLIPIKKLAHQYNVPTPTLDAVIHFSSLINQTDYMEKGLSLEELGIAGLNRDELNRLLDEGFE